MSLARIDPELLAAIRAADIDLAPRFAERGVAALRREFAERYARIGDPLPTVVTEEVALEVGTRRVAARITRPREGAARGLLVWLHGGGWVVGTARHSDALASRLAVGAGCTVASIDYRLAPEHRFPAAVDDAFDALRHLGDGEQPIAVGGDSAGGNLAAAAALRARDEGGPPLALQLLVYPVLEREFDSAAMRENARGLALERETMRWFWEQYAAGDVISPYLEPIVAESLEGVAPAHIVAAELDVLRDQAVAYAARLRSSGVEAECCMYDGALHGFMAWAGQVSLATRASDAAVRALRDAFAAPVPPRPVTPS
jgi:acetyl esterase/lipase